MKKVDEKYDKSIRERLNKIRDAQTIITKEINALYNDILEHEEGLDAE